MQRTLIITFVMILGISPVVKSQASLQTKSKLKENVIYGMYSGLALLMDVHYPDNANGFGIIYIAGSGWSSGMGYDPTPLKNTAQVDIYCKPLLEAGYTVFAINHRASPRFHYPAAVEDVQRAVRYVRHFAKSFGVNAEKIGAAGGSSGGHLVSLLGVLDGKGDPNDPDPINHESSKVQCVVARAAPIDLAKGIPGGKDSTWYMAVSGFMGARLNDSSDRAYRDASPVSWVSADDPPFLLMHGDADKVVNFKNSEMMEQALKQVRVKVKLLRINGGDHGFDFPGAKNLPDYLGEMVHWFDQYLRNK